MASAEAESKPAVIRAVNFILSVVVACCAGSAEDGCLDLSNNSSKSGVYTGIYTLQSNFHTTSHLSHSGHCNERIEKFRCLSMQTAQSEMKSASAWIPAAEAITAHIGHSSAVTDMPSHKSHSRCEYAQGRPAVHSRDGITQGAVSYARKPSGAVCHHAGIPT